MEVNIDSAPPDLPDMLNMPDLSVAFDRSPGKIRTVPVDAGMNGPAIPAFDSLPAFDSVAAQPFSAAGAAPESLSLSTPAGDQPAGVAFDSPPVEAAEREPDRFDPDIFAALAADPTTRSELEWLQTQTSNKVLTVIDEVYGMLPPETMPQSSKPLSAGPQNIRMLMIAQRQGELMSKERRALAEAIVMGSLINVDNPQWNPGDAATGESGAPSALAALISMSL